MRLIGFLFRVRRRFSHYQNYIRQLDSALENAQNKAKRLAVSNTHLSHRIRALEAEIESLEDELGDCDDGDDDEQYIDPELFDTLEESGINPARSYSVGELLAIKQALQSAQI